MNTSTRHLQRRGQALVEFTVMAGVFIVVLLGGTYLAEAQIIGLKLNEAATFAAFDVNTQPTVRVRPVGEEHRATAISNTAARVHDRYRDFDGTSPTGGPPAVQQVATNSEFTLDCDPSFAYPTDFFSDDGPEFNSTVNGDYFGYTGAHILVNTQNLHAAHPTYLSLLAALRGVFQEDAQSPSIACRARARVRQTALTSLGRVIGAGTAAINSVIDMCAPRRQDGTCGRYNVLAGDWAMEPGGGANDAAKDCPQRTGFAACNKTYLFTVEKLFTAGGPDRNTAVGRDISSNSPGSWTNELDFIDPGNSAMRRFSYAGEEHDFWDQHSGAGMRSRCFNSSGVFGPNTGNYAALVGTAGGGAGRQGNQLTVGQPCPGIGMPAIQVPTRLNGNWLGLPAYPGGRPFFPD